MAAVGVLSVDIPANESLSGGVDLGTNNLVAIEVPAGVTLTQISFLSKTKGGLQQGDNASYEDDENWRPVFDSSGSEVTMTVAENQIVVPTAAVAAALAPLRFLRIRSGTSTSPVNINPTVSLKIITKQS